MRSIQKQLKLWKKLTKELRSLGDGNYKARIIFDYITRNILK